MKTRYKVMIWLGVLLVAYVAVAVAAWRIMPAKIAEAERKRPAVTMALMKVANDQLAVSRRLSEITKKTLGSGQDKVAQVTMILGDDELNRFALTYMGADWATMYSSFSGNVKHMRDLLKMQKEDRKDGDNDLDRKIKDLEIRRNQMTRSIDVGGNRHKQRQWEEELRDVDKKLASLRSTQSLERRRRNGSSGDANDAKARCEKELFKLAGECEAKTIEQLVQSMANQATALRYEEAEPERMRHQMSYFNIWPLNKLTAMPL